MTVITFFFCICFDYLRSSFLKIYKIVKSLLYMFHTCIYYFFDIFFHYTPIFHILYLIYLYMLIKANSWIYFYRIF